jgi:signal transduction histidine kinase
MRERERLARDLHDLVIQRIFAAGMGLQSIGTLIDNELAAQRVEHTVDELDATINEIRTAIFHLTRRQSGATNPIGDVIGHSSEYLGFEPTLTIDGDLATVPAEIIEQLVAVITESLSNVAHHAHATRVDIALSNNQNQTTLIVADNGIGIHHSASQGNGLGNLAERARQHGGTLTITAGSDGTGTVVTWTAHA